MRFAVTVAFLLLLDGTAHAQARVVRRDEAPSRTWYGWQVAIADGAAGGLLLLGAETESRALLFTSVGVYAIVPPAIHGFHDEDLGFGLSLALRATLPPLLLLMTFDRGGDDSSSGEALGVSAPLAGAIVASAIDISVLSWTWQSSSGRRVVRPALQWDHERIGVAFVGAF